MSLLSRGLARRAVAGAAAACAVLVVTGCATKGTPYATPSSSAAVPAATATAPAPTVSMSALPKASGQLTGTQLTQVLLPQSSFPAGYSLSSSSAVNSGDSLTTSPAQYNLATVSCADFVNHLGNTGFGETGMAANSYIGQASEQAFDQVVYQFGSDAAASAFLSGLQALANRCHSFNVTENGARGAFSIAAAAGSAVGGHPSVALSQTGSISGSAVTLDTLFTASGVDVFAGAAVGVGAGVPTGLATSTIVYDLMKRQAAAAVLG